MSSTVTEEAQLKVKIEQRESGEDMQDQLHLLGWSLRGGAGNNRRKQEAGSRKEDAGSRK
ncbi:hypothetical protein N7523_002178 [Penicillium sp. IBT 18751x]|nr:hypothetical protein N7523_002178 [Penicillium sp. IBT 18751x]